MVDPVREVRNAAPSAPSADWMLDELRHSITSIADDLKHVAEARTRAAKEQAQDSAAALRRGIRQEPFLAMAIAAAAGAALAVAAMPRSRRSFSRWDAWRPSMPPVTRADLYDLADSVQRSATRAANSVPLSSSLERLLEALSKAEPGAPLTAIVEKAGGLIQRLRSAVKI